MWQCYIVDFPHWPEPRALLSLSLTSSDGGSHSNPVSRRPLAVGGTTVTFYRCRPFLCSRARGIRITRVRYTSILSNAHTRVDHRTHTTPVCLDAPTGWPRNNPRVAPPDRRSSISSRGPRYDGFTFSAIFPIFFPPLFPSLPPINTFASSPPSFLKLAISRCSLNLWLVFIRFPEFQPTRLSQ